MPTRESVAFNRYADKSIAETEEEKAIFQQPRGEKLRTDYQTQLFKMQKTDDHIEQLRQKKSYIADGFFNTELKQSDLIEVFKDCIKKIFNN